ncbi:MAG TPA: hypothetical protein VGY77_00730 [Gemmataceae bacterium]|jgi:hypothetical protein|nr:hypothetical protein [Gemmataceae bacterium]
MTELFRKPRVGPQPQALHFSYEKAGLTIYDQPIPWNAQAVLVEASLRLPPSVARRKAEFTVRIPGKAPITAETLRRQETGDQYRLFFRIPPPQQTVPAELVWQNRSLGQITLPFLGREEFLDQLRLLFPTFFVRLEDQTVACQTFVSTQCKGLMASGVISSPTSLVPLLDLGLQVEFRSERKGPVQIVPAQMNASQWNDRQALITVIPRRFPRRIGGLSATWMVGDRILHTHRVRAISQRHFHRSLRLSDTRFVIDPVEGKMHVARSLPAPETLVRAGPCFLVSSKEPGMAGWCRLRIRVHMTGGVHSPVMMEQDALITDGPTMIAPGTLEVADLAPVSGFELLLKDESLGTLSTSPIPIATFTNEGGFKSAGDYTWSTAAEEELNERLNRLLEDKTNGKS